MYENADSDAITINKMKSVAQQGLFIIQQQHLKQLFLHETIKK